MKNLKNIRDDFPEILLNEMRRKNINKADFARLINVTDTTVHCYIKGTAKPRDVILERMAKALNCSVNDFLYGGE